MVQYNKEDDNRESFLTTDREGVLTILKEVDFNSKYEEINAMTDEVRDSASFLQELSVGQVIAELQAFPPELPIRLMDINFGYIPIRSVNRSERVEPNDEDFVWVSN